MELLGCIISALIGVSLGLIGAGGSILTVPVLVYLFGLPPALATSYSLFVVGSTSFLGAAEKYRQKEVLGQTAITFGLSSMVVVALVRRLLIPAIPEKLFRLGKAEITYSSMSMTLFALLMCFSALSMIRSRQEKGANSKAFSKNGHIRLFSCAILVGLVTGLLGAGGGFVIIPVLTLILKLDIKKAIGTSLAIIAINTLTGFISDAGHYEIKWPFLLLITAISIAGSWAGLILSKRIDGSSLKIGFGWFVLFLGLLILTREANQILHFA